MPELTPHHHDLATSVVGDLEAARDVPGEVSATCRIIGGDGIEVEGTVAAPCSGCDAKGVGDRWI